MEIHRNFLYNISVQLKTQKTSDLDPRCFAHGDSQPHRSKSFLTAISAKQCIVFKTHETWRDFQLRLLICIELVEKRAV